MKKWLYETIEIMFGSSRNDQIIWDEGLKMMKLKDKIDRARQKVDARLEKEFNAGDSNNSIMLKLAFNLIGILDTEHIERQIKHILRAEGEW